MFSKLIKDGASFTVTEKKTGTELHGSSKLQSNFKYVDGVQIGRAPDSGTLRLPLLASANFNPLQSVYRTGHSTETVIIKILHDFYAGINNKQLTILVSLGISAAFDTICHSKLLQRLYDDFEVRGTALK